MSTVLARQSKNQFQLTITLPQTKVEETYQHVLEEAAKQVELPGFRKGHVPPTKAVEKLDQSKLYEEVLRHLLPKYYLEALKEHQLKPIIDPRFELLDTSPDKDWQIRATSAEAPEVHLHDYQSKLTGFLKTSAIWTPDKPDQPQSSTSNSALQNPTHPSEPTDPTSKSSTADQLNRIIDFLLKEITIDPADILVGQQANRLLSQLLEQVNKLGMTIEQYAQAAQKTLEALRAEYANRAREELRLEFILGAIAETEKITITDEDLQKFIDSSPDNKTKQQLQTPEQKNYLRLMLQRQKVLDFLLKLAN